MTSSPFAEIPAVPVAGGPPVVGAEVMMPPGPDTAAGVAYALLQPANAAISAQQLPALALIDSALGALGQEAERIRAEAILAQCGGALVKAMNATAAGDVLEAVQHLELLRGLVAAAPARDTAVDLEDVEEVPEPQWVCKGLDWCPGRPAMIIGYPGSGKTLAVHAAGLALATGRPVWGCPDFRPARPMRVLHLDFDQGVAASVRRYRRFQLGMGITSADLVRARHEIAEIRGCSPSEVGKVLRVKAGAADLRLMSFEGFAAFESAWARTVLGFDVVIVDSLRKLAPVLDENDSRFGEIPEALRRVSEATGCMFLLLHHTGRNKPSDKRPVTQAGRGTSAIDGAAGSQLVFEEENPGDPPRQRRRRVVHARASADAEGHIIEPFYLHFAEGDLAARPVPLRAEYRTEEQMNGPAERPGDKLAKIKAAILVFLRKETAARRAVAGKDALAAVLGLDARLVRAAVDQLEADGLIVNQPEKSGRGPAKARLWANLSAPATAEVEEEMCPRCRGAGTIAEYAHKEGGKCFACNGTGTRRGKGGRVVVASAPLAAGEVDREVTRADAELEPEREGWMTHAAPVAASPEEPKATPARMRSDPLAEVKEAILGVVRLHPGAPGRTWVREQLRPLAMRGGAVDAGWYELVRSGKLKDHGARGAPAFHVEEAGANPFNTTAIAAVPEVAGAHAPSLATPSTVTAMATTAPASSSGATRAARSHPEAVPGSEPPPALSAPAPAARAVAAVEAPTTTEMRAAGGAPLRAFLAECCVVAPSAKITRSELRAAFVAWAHLQGLESSFSNDDLAALGFEPAKVRHAESRQSERGWRGVGLRAAVRAPLPEESSPSSSR